MKRFRTITAICLTAIGFMVAANIWYMYGLYGSIKEQTMKTVTECIRRADILEIITRLKKSDSNGSNDSFIRMTLMVEGEKRSYGGYDYTHLLENIMPTMSGYFHVIEKVDSFLPERDYDLLDSLFVCDLNKAGLYPEEAVIYPASDYENVKLWKVPFAIDNTQEPIFTAYISPLNVYILGRMSGIVVTSMTILLLMIFLVWYLLYKVGKLRTIEQMKDDFTHNMTHELKTPVAVAYSAADSMLRYYDQSDENRNRQFLKIIIQRLGFLSGMIENILSMSMERFKSVNLNIETIALRPLVEEVAGMMELKAEKPIYIEIDIADNLKIKADSLHMGNVISNLLDNAFKYSGESVKISIKADSESISVSDNGLGIDKADLPFIFDKFYRVTSGDRYETGGYGLGLFYVKQIIKLHGWDITVTSKPGMGSTFKIKIRSNEKE